jgi:hypothetical protein
MNSSDLVDKIKILEDEIRRYRVLIEAISQPKSNEHDNEGKHASLVRYIMEMVKILLFYSRTTFHML